MCGTPVIFPSTIGCCDAIAPHAKFIFAPDNVADLRATLERAVAAHRDGMRRAPSERARDAVLYDPGVAAHVDALLRLAEQLDATR
jgi:hypothetical protein